MATLFELGASTEQGDSGAASFSAAAGQVVVAVDAQLQTPRTIYRGIPWNTPGAELRATEYRIVSPLVAGYGGTTGGLFEVVASTDPEDTPGRVDFIGSNFRGFLGDYRTTHMLEQAGVALIMSVSEDGSETIGFERTDGSGQREVANWTGHKILPLAISDPDRCN